MDRPLAAHDEWTSTSFPRPHCSHTLHTQARTPPHTDTLQTQHGPLHTETHTDLPSRTPHAPHPSQCCPAGASTGNSACVRAKSLQSCLTLCNAMDCSPPGSSVHGILQARRLEWVYHALLQGIFPTQGPNLRLLRLLHQQAGSLPLASPGKPVGYRIKLYLALGTSLTSHHSRYRLNNKGTRQRANGQGGMSERAV